jgi:dinuclear metal center YbgI/SA1388 family protein
MSATTPPAARDEILRYVHEYLGVAVFRDYGPQGLQVEGRPEVRKVVSGVSASAELLERAVEAGADMVIAHHGIFWDNESRVVKGGLRRRLKGLLDSNVTLAAYHLCLDAHPMLGNNALAAQGLGLHHLQGWSDRGGKCLGVWGHWDPIPVAEAVRRVNALYRSTSLEILGGPEQVRTVGIISGGAQGEIRAAIELGLDLFVTGEASEYVMPSAREGGIHFLAAGHHNTERLGIRALGEHISARFRVAHEFIDIPNPV